MKDNMIIGYQMVFAIEVLLNHPHRMTVSIVRRPALSCYLRRVVLPSLSIQDAYVGSVSNW